MKKKNRKRLRRNKKALRSLPKVTDAAVAGETAAKDVKPAVSETKPEKGGERSGDKEKEQKKFSLGEIFEVVKLVLDSLGKPLKKLLKRTRISHLALEIVCGGSDAAKAALNYGRMNIVVGNALNWVDGFFTLKTVDDLHIGVDFQCEKTKTSAYCEVRLTLIAALAFVFTLLGRAARFYLSHGDAKSAVDKFIKK